MHMWFCLCALRKLVLFVSALAGGKELPMGGTFGNALEMLRTTTTRSQTCPEL